MQRNPLIQQIDHSLKSHYHQICFNPEKRDILHRLSYQSAPPVRQSYLLSHPSQETPPFLNNHLLNNYIQYVYHKYQIEDPIHKEFRLCNQHPNGAMIESSTPNIQANGIPYILQKPETTKSKLQQMRRSYKQDSSEILYSRHFRGSEAESYMTNTGFKQQTRPKEIGYKTKQKIQFKNIVNIERSTSATPRQSHSVSRKEVPSLKAGLPSPKAFADTQTSLLQSEVPVVFRYCPMCEEVVLQCNIPYHQAHCPLIQQAYQLPLEELQSNFSQKVQTMIQELGDQMKEEEQKKMAGFRVLKERLKDWLGREDEESFLAVKDEYYKLTLGQYYLVTKLNWFKRLQRRIIKERHLQASYL